MKFNLLEKLDDEVADEHSGCVGSDQSGNLWSVGAWRQLLAANGWHGPGS